MSGRFEVRCPVHGFIKLDSWERDIVDHPVFQRLRRIRQLAWTDMVYPGAVHNRFEHSLGVMHTASMMYSDLWERRSDQLTRFGFSSGGGRGDRNAVIIRLAALLHDVGHSPFSHAGEDLMPVNPATKKEYKHEDYSAAIIREFLTDVIDRHPYNRANFGITADDVARMIEGPDASGEMSFGLFWRQLISSQLDADRADYLLRDSHHIGVQYGRYDLSRLIISLTAARNETDALVLAMDAGGIHTAEALILARYMMFTQVYYHPTRVAYDQHVKRAMGALLKKHEPEGLFPPPTTRENLDRYLNWTDWRALGMIQNGEADEHGEALQARQHMRAVYQTNEIASIEEVQEAKAVHAALVDAGIDSVEWSSSSGWYKYADNEILVLTKDDDSPDALRPLSTVSAVVKGLAALNLNRVYAPYEHRQRAREIVSKLRSKGS